MKGQKKIVFLRYILLCVIIFACFFKIIVLLWQNWQASKWVEVHLVQVLDGDTVEVREGEGDPFAGPHRKSPKDLYRVRLAYIDAPEKEQRSFQGRRVGELSHRYLQYLVKEKKEKEEKFYLKKLHLDMYGRWIGVLSIVSPEREKEKLVINFLMVQEGFAFLYPFSKFSSQLEKKTYLRAYYQAYHHHKGLFKRGDRFLNPYQFRKTKKLGHLKKAL